MSVLKVSLCLPVSDAYNDAMLYIIMIANITIVITRNPRLRVIVTAAARLPSDYQFYSLSIRPPHLGCCNLWLFLGEFLLNDGYLEKVANVTARTDYGLARNKAYIRQGGKTQVHL